MVEAPIMPLCSVSEDINKTGALTQTEPLAIYDYLKIKEASKAENAGRKLPISAYDNISGTISAAKMVFSLFSQLYSKIYHYEFREGILQQCRPALLQRHLQKVR